MMTDVGAPDPRMWELTLDKDHPRFELWVDGRHQVRKFTIGSAQGSTTVTVNSYDQPVTVKAPAPGKVKPAS